MKNRVRILKKNKRKIIMKFPHVWITIIIAVLALVSLGISIYLECKSKGFASSIFSNIFAGLLTGLIICLISGIKQMSVSVRENKTMFLEELEKSLTEYFKLYDELSKSNIKSDEYFQLLNNVAVKVTFINNFISLSAFNSLYLFDTYKYCKEELAYDAKEKEKDCNKLYYNVLFFNKINPAEEEISGCLFNVYEGFVTLNYSVYNAKQKNKIESEMLEHTII